MDHEQKTNTSGAWRAVGDQAVLAHLPRQVAAGAVWESACLDVAPHRYWRVAISATCRRACLWAIVFVDHDGQPLVSDIYDALLPGADGLPQVSIIRVHPDAERLFLRVDGGDTGVTLDALGLTSVSRETARLDCDELAAAFPFVRFDPPAGRGALLPATMRRLREGGALRIVMLGDSICNDLSNGLFELALGDLPGASGIHVTTSVRGSTGCAWYSEGDRLEAHAMRYAPDLVVLAGISHAFDVDAIRDTVRLIRQRPGCEVLVLDDAIASHRAFHRYVFRFAAGAAIRPFRARDAAERRRIAETVRAAEQFSRRLRCMCERERIACFSIRDAWDRYMTDCGLPRRYFMRDETHANRYGKQVAARLLAQYLVPDD